MEANAGKALQMQIIFNIFPLISLHCKLVTVQYWEYEYGLFVQLRMWKHKKFRMWTRDLAMPMLRSKQLSYEPTDMLSPQYPCDKELSQWLLEKEKLFCFQSSWYNPLAS